MTRYYCLGGEPGCERPFRETDAPKKWSTEEHENNQKVYQAAKTEVTQVDQYEGKLFLAWCTHGTSDNQG